MRYDLGTILLRWKAIRTKCCLFYKKKLIKKMTPWLQNVLTINSWPHCIKGGKEVQALGIKEGGERVTDVIRIITWIKGDSTVIDTCWQIEYRESLLLKNVWLTDLRYCFAWLIIRNFFSRGHTWYLAFSITSLNQILCLYH